MPNSFFPEIPDEVEDFINGLRNERQVSAVVAMFMAWIQYSSEVGRGRPHLVPLAAVDMSLLFRATAETFVKWPPQPISQSSAGMSGLTPFEQLENRLKSIPDAKTAEAATVFIQTIAKMAAEAKRPQDLVYMLELFLRSVEDVSIDAIITGAVSKKERRPIDLNTIALDYW